jgi:hypothetical protein
MIGPPNFPRLTAENHRVTSPATADYNCVAWSAGDTERWWEPGVYWPIDADMYGPDALEQAFRALGYELCPDGSLEEGREKVALYAAGQFYTHAARQLTGGKWTSKLGRLEDIEHDHAEDVAGGVYGEVFRFMSRAFTAGGGRSST